MVTAVDDVRADRNSLGKASFAIGVLGLILSFIPIIGFVSWLLAPLAILLGLIALRKRSRSFAAVGIVTGAIALFICFSWLNATEAVGTAMNADTFNKTGETTDLTDAPIVDATVKGVWDDMEENKIAAGEKYGKKRLRFTDEKIEDFGGTLNSPQISIIGKNDQYISLLVNVSFSEKDGKKLSALKKGENISFVCQSVKENFGDGYSLSDCEII